MIALAGSECSVRVQDSTWQKARVAISRAFASLLTLTAPFLNAKSQVCGMH